MICDHLVCQAMGQTCELTYGEAPAGALDKHDDAPPDERMELFERELAAIDVEALRVIIRGERARRLVAQLFDDIVMHEKYDLASTHDPEQRRAREHKLIGRLREITVDVPQPSTTSPSIGPAQAHPGAPVPVTASTRAPLRTPDAT